LLHDLSIGGGGSTNIMSILGELKRRNVFRMGAAYVALSWLIIQVAETLFPLFGLSDTAARAVVVIAAVGFIPALIFAWAFELTPEGLKRDADVDRDSAVSVRRTRRLDRLIMVFLALALAYFAFDKFSLTPQRQAEDLAAATEDARAAGRAESLVESYGDDSIAVLPFVNMSSDPEQEYFADGISEELLNLLARIPKLRVISRSSAFSFKGKDIDIPTIAKQLSVAHILEGSVRKSGNQVRITAQLIEARSDTHLWSETFDRSLDDIFAIQDEVAAEVVKQLRLVLLDDPPKATPANPHAFLLFLQAQQILALGRYDEYPKAEALLKQALGIDPDYVDALVELARAQHGRRDPRALESLDRALALDPDNAQAKALMATERWIRHQDRVGAARLLEEAARAGPYDPFVLFNTARLATVVGKNDLAIRLGEYIAARDPLFFWAQLNLAWNYFEAGRIDDALDRYAIAISLNPTDGAVRWKTGLAWLAAGEPELALAEFEKEEGRAYRLHGLALAYHDLGREEESAAAFEELLALEEGEAWPYGMARAYAWIGNADEAFFYLEAAAKQFVTQLGGAASNPLFRKLHGDPRWMPFLRSVNQAPEQVAAFEFNVEPPE